MREKVFSLKRFCSDCGKELITKQVNFRHNIYTGELEYDIKWSCPNKKWFNLLKHPTHITDIFGYE